MIDARTPRAEAATAAAEHLTADLSAAALFIPDMSPDELIDLRESLNVLTEAIDKQQNEQDWVRRNEH